MRLKINRNRLNGALFCDFALDGQEYHASLCEMLYDDYETECMIFKARGGRVTDWGGEYCERGIPVTEESLRECVMNFIDLKKQENGNKEN